VSDVKMEGFDARRRQRVAFVSSAHEIETRSKSRKNMNRCRRSGARSTTDRAPERPYSQQAEASPGDEALGRGRRHHAQMRVKRVSKHYRYSRARPFPSRRPRAAARAREWSRAPAHTAPLIAEWDRGRRRARPVDVPASRPTQKPRLQLSGGTAKRRGELGDRNVLAT